MIRCSSYSCYWATESAAKTCRALYTRCGWYQYLIEDLDGERETEGIINQLPALDKADLDFASTASFYMRLCLLCIVYNAENAHYVGAYHYSLVIYGSSTVPLSLHAPARPLANEAQ